MSRLRCAQNPILLAVVLAGAGYPMLREAFPAALHVLCGVPVPDHSAIVRTALEGKLVYAGALALLLPAVLRPHVGTWTALAHIPLVRGILGTSAVVTSALTAYDLCTGYHSAERTSQGCACWLTAALAAAAALIAALCVLGGRAMVRSFRHALIAIVEAFFRLERRWAPLAGRFRAVRAVLHPAGALLARRSLGRGPPARLRRFTLPLASGAV